MWNLLQLQKDLRKIRIFIYYFRVSMSQKSAHILNESPIRGLTRLQLRCWSGCILTRGLTENGILFFVCLFEISLKFSAGLISLWCGKWQFTSLGQARGSLQLLWPSLSHLTILPCTFEVLAINKFLLCSQSTWNICIHPSVQTFSMQVMAHIPGFIRQPMTIST